MEMTTSITMEDFIAELDRSYMSAIRDHENKLRVLKVNLEAKKAQYKLLKNIEKLFGSCATFEYEVALSYYSTLKCYVNPNYSVCKFYNLLQDYLESLCYFEILDFTENKNHGSQILSFRVRDKSYKGDKWDGQLEFVIVYRDNHHCKVEKVTKQKIHEETEYTMVCSV